MSKEREEVHYDKRRDAPVLCFTNWNVELTIVTRLKFLNSCIRNWYSLSTVHCPGSHSFVSPRCNCARLFPFYEQGTYVVAFS